MTGTFDRRERILRQAPPGISGEAAPRRGEGGGGRARETVGHPIDPASNNQQRRFRALAGPKTSFPGRGREAWVAARALFAYECAGGDNPPATVDGLAADSGGHPGHRRARIFGRQGAAGGA